MPSDAALNSTGQQQQLKCAGAACRYATVADTIAAITIYAAYAIRHAAHYARL